MIIIIHYCKKGCGLLGLWGWWVGGSGGGVLYNLNVSSTVNKMQDNVDVILSILNMLLALITFCYPTKYVTNSILGQAFCKL